jgi:hypothetical protein
MSSANEPPRLVEGRDYTVENGRWVFTEYFLRQRGYCCRSGCRHCPYGFRTGATQSQENGHEKAQKDTKK